METTNNNNKKHGAILSFFLSLSIRTKILVLVILFNLISTAVFTYFHYSDVKKVVQTSIDKRSKTVAYGAQNLLRPYHEKIENAKSIKNEEYIDMLLKLSTFAKEVEVAYVYSFMYHDGKVVYTSTSASDDDLAKENFDDFFAPYDEASQTLKTLLTNQSMDLVYESSEDKYGAFHSVFIPFVNKYGHKYVVGVDIEISYIAKMLKTMIMQVSSAGFVIFIFSVVLFLIALRFVLAKIPMITEGITQFFKYLKKETNSVSYIKNKSQDELGVLAELINSNISIAEKNINRDNDLILGIKDVSSHIAQGSFEERITYEAHSPSLNEAKKIINAMLDNIQEVISQVIEITHAYSNHNYNTVLNKDLYSGDFLALVTSINTLGKNISQEKLNDAYNSLSIQKSSNYLRKFIEEVIYSLDAISSDLQNFSGQLRSNEKFIVRLQNKLEEMKKERVYLQSLVVQLTDTAAQDTRKQQELLRDMSHSLHIFDENLELSNKELSKEITDIKSLREPLELLNEDIREKKKLAENTIQISSDLSAVSNKIRDSIIECDFIGKDNINIMMQHVDR